MAITLALTNRNLSSVTQLYEALELARITASVSHNHPEGIKGAQAIAACIYLKRTEDFNATGAIRSYDSINCNSGKASYNQQQ